MHITLHNPNRRLHGKLHKCDPYYFRFHYGKQRLVFIQKQYIDRPTANQQASRNTFTTIRKEVSRQLHDPILRARWERKFKQEKAGYKFLHTYVYAQLKAGITVTQSSTCQDTLQERFSYALTCIPVCLHPQNHPLASIVKKQYLCKFKQLRL